MAQWIERYARSEGIVEGRREEASALLLMLGSIRFGDPDAQALAALAAATEIEALERLASRLLEVESWQELLA